MIAATDVYYYDDSARAVCVLSGEWTDAAPAAVHTQRISPVAAYEPGAFYKRELPCLLQLLQPPVLEQVTCIVVDGFVVLDDKGRPGLGHYLYEALQGKVPVIGVAKTGFHNNRLLVREVFRGDSRRPLYVTSVGIPVDESAQLIHNMHGPHRIPTILKHLDQLSRGQSPV